MYYVTAYRSPLGRMTLASDGESLLGLWNEGQKYHGASIPEAMQEKEDIPLFAQTKRWLEDYFSGKQPAPSDLPLAPIGSEFRQSLWRILTQIPYGEWISYGEIAKHLARSMGLASMSAQAVGGAVGHNPISIIIPCHRVLASNGGLTGYAAGLTVKRKLLELEGVDLSALSTCAKERRAQTQKQG